MGRMTGKQFKSIIESRNLSQKAVARSIGITPQQLSNYLNGTIRELSKSKYYRLCQELEVNVLF
ncbi:helix-turn-helix domain-containing protein [Bacillus infantis]|uniref:helix-turn-helix domain-containing protein n=1 Tax=Bacillus infantis TaxID=324767 RepID=UPI003CE99F57